MPRVRGVVMRAPGRFLWGLAWACTTLLAWRVAYWVGHTDARHAMPLECLWDDATRAAMRARDTLPPLPPPRRRVR